MFVSCDCNHHDHGIFVQPASKNNKLQEFIHSIGCYIFSIYTSFSLPARIHALDICACHHAHNISPQNLTGAK